MKAEASMWVWITGTVVIGLMILGVSAMIISGMMAQQERNSIIEKFATLSNKADAVCQGGRLNTDYFSITLPESVEAVYPANSSYEKPPRTISRLVSAGEFGIGNFVCLKFFDEETSRCRKLSCFANMTYIGTPSMSPSLFSMLSKLTGSGPQYDYFLQMVKSPNGTVDVEAKQVLPGQGRPVCGNGILETGEQCENGTACESGVGMCGHSECRDCVCVPVLECANCEDGIGNSGSDWCKYCSSPETCDNGIDDDCDGKMDTADEECEVPGDDDEEGKTLILLFFQINGGISNFDSVTKQMTDTFVSRTPLKNCPEVVDYVAVEDVCNVGYICNLENAFNNFLKCIKNSRYQGKYTKALGIVGSTPCDWGGVTWRYGDRLFAQRSTFTSTHELGHTFGLCDEGYGNTITSSCSSGFCNCGETVCSCSGCTDCCPNRPEANSVMCVAQQYCGRSCSTGNYYASSSYVHLEEELNKYCGG